MTEHDIVKIVGIDKADRTDSGTHPIDEKGVVVGIPVSTKLFEVNVKLNVQPSDEWIDHFYNPKTFVSYPYIRDFEVIEDTIRFRAIESDLEKFIRQLENYINQANAAWQKHEREIRQKRVVEEQEREQRQAEGEKVKQKLQELLKKSEENKDN